MDASVRIEPARLRKGLVVAAAAFGAALVPIITRNPFGPVVMVVVGILILAAASKAWLRARRDPTWLAFVLMLAQLLDGLFFLTDQIRPIVTYGVILLFCLPAIPLLWRAWNTRSGFRLYLLFCLWCLITVSYSIAPEYSLSRLVRNFLLFAAITVCSASARKDADIKPVVKAMTLAAVAVTMLTAAAVLLPHSITWHTDEEALVATQNAGTGASQSGDDLPRFSGLFVGPNEVGEVAGLTIALILVYFEFAERKERIIFGLIAILAVALAVMADSRSDMVGLAIGSTLYLLWRYGLKGIAAISLGALVAALLLMAAGDDVTRYIWRGDVSTLTGRTDVWRFAIQQIAAKPLLGYGWAVGGAIFGSKYFPIWYGPFDQGPHSSLHSGYLTFMVGVGIPATIFWLFIILRPWVSLFRGNDDTWRLKRLFFFVVIPMLIINLDESIITDCSGAAGFLFMMTWALAEQFRLASIRRVSSAARQQLEELPVAVAALRLP